MKEIREMTLEEVNTRMGEISEELRNEGADVDALNSEVEKLEERKAELKKEERAALLDKVSQEGQVIETMQMVNSATEVKNYGADSVEYRNAYLKNLAVDKEGRSIFGEMTKEERGAFTFTTANTGNVVPTLIMDRIVEFVSSMAPMYDDATKTAIAEGFRLARHTAITQGDAATTLEGIANDDETDTFDYIPLAGVEIKKHANVTRKMRFQSIGAFEDWLVSHIALRILAAKDKRGDRSAVSAYGNLH